jgi:hypothetical protein
LAFFLSLFWRESEGRSVLGFTTTTEGEWREVFVHSFAK